MARKKARKVGLPDDIIVDILIQLPAKSIGQFRCVSKHWCSLLSDPQFLKAHHNIHAHKAETKLVFISGSHSLHTITFNPQNRNDGISRKLNFQQLPDNWDRIVGCCNGLVLVRDKENIKFLINPTTLKYHRIPNFELLPPKPRSYARYGLGYDSATDDYKVVALSRYCTSGVKSTFVDIYSVKKGFWRRLESAPFDHADPMIVNGVLANGALHWLTSNYSRVIVAFHLSEETFFEVPTPSAKKFQYAHDLVALRGCLCMVTDAKPNKFDVWMMKDYGVKESWTKFSVRVPISSLHCLFPSFLTSHHHIILKVDNGEKLIVYNTKEDQWWDMMVDKISSKFKTTGIFRESLVSPTFGKGTEGYFIA